MSEFATIFDAATACRCVLRTATTTPRLMRQEWAENRLADFNLWASSAGASVIGKASLDYRLREKLDAHTILINLLSMLHILVQKCIDQAPSIGESAVELSGEELAVRKDVEDNLNQLTRLTVVIRKAGARSRLQKADSSFDPNNPQIISLRQHLVFLLLVRPDEHGGSDSFGQQLGLRQVTPIQQRLINANLRRRNRFLYAQKHARKLADNFRPLQPTPIAAQPLIKPVPRTEASTSVYSAAVGESVLGSTTTATMVDEAIVIPPKQQVAMSTTTAISITTTRLSYPKPPVIHDDQSLFTCPCCCQSLPVAVGRGNQWKKHLARDIFPYTCILEECPQPELLHMTKESWSDHMEKAHESMKQWVCQACSQKNISASFKEPAEFTLHLEQQHHRRIKPQQIPMLLSAWQRKVPFKIPTCPLCLFDSEDQSILLDHIAEHIHSFSLRSLPWPATDSPGETHEEQHKSYFDKHPYFDVESAQSEISSNSSDMSSLNIESESLADPDNEELTSTTQAEKQQLEEDMGSESVAGPSYEELPFATQAEQQQLTENALENVPNDMSRQASTGDWLDVLNARTSLADDNVSADNESLRSDSSSWGSVDTEENITPHISGKSRRPSRGSRGEGSGGWAGWVYSRLGEGGGTPGEDVSKCHSCGESFNSQRRKYHCRICGNVFDLECTATLSGQHYGLSDTESTRVCKLCGNGTISRASRPDLESSRDRNPPTQRVTSWRESFKRRLRLSSRKPDRKT